MTHPSISASLTKLPALAIKRVRWIAFLLVATFASVMPASAQSGDTWKSVAIIGGSTAAGAYIGHNVAGTKGAYIGAGVGAATGYAIDRRRRQNETNNNAGYPYPDNGSYGDNGGYYGNNYPDPGNGGYYPDSYQSNGYVSNQSQVRRRR